jgi:hypothetical protein
VLDPFFGTGTTGAVARQLHRHYIGIEIDPYYAQLATQRIAAIEQQPFESSLYETPNPRRERRIPFGSLVEHGLLEPGQILYFEGQDKLTARVLADGHLKYAGQRGSIHQTARWIRNGPANGWQLWYYLNRETGQLEPIDTLRNRLRKEG